MNKKANVSYYLGLAVLIAIACFYFAYSKLLPQYKAHKAELALTQAEVKAIDVKIRSLDSSKSTLADLGDVVNKMLIAVPDGKDAPNLVTELEALAIKHKVYIPNIQISEPTSTAESENNTISVSLSASGGYSDLHQFIQGIEKDLRFMNIENMTISSVGDQVSVSLQIDTFKRTNLALSTESSSINQEVAQ